MHSKLDPEDTVLKDLIEDDKESKASSRFTDPPIFNDAKLAQAINGINPGDEGYMEAWSEKNGIPYEKREELYLPKLDGYACPYPRRKLSGLSE